VLLQKLATKHYTYPTATYLLLRWHIGSLCQEDYYKFRILQKSESQKSTTANLSSHEQFKQNTSINW